MITPGSIVSAINCFHIWRVFFHLYWITFPMQLNFSLLFSYYSMIKPNSIVSAIHLLPYIWRVFLFPSYTELLFQCNLILLHTKEYFAFGDNKNNLIQFVSKTKKKDMLPNANELFLIASKEIKICFYQHWCHEKYNLLLKAYIFASMVQ
jgi:hypothetical protein